MNAGVLALQGDFREHLAMLRSIGVDAVEVRTPEDLDGVDALVIPGGESTTIGKLADRYGLIEPVRQRCAEGMPVLGTCAGMIFLAASTVSGHQPQLGVLDAVVERNAFGRQIDSFEADLRIEGMDRPMRGVFIRAPRITRTGPGVYVRAKYKGEPTVVESDRVLAATFHPEATEDLRMHERFIKRCALQDSVS